MGYMGDDDHHHQRGPTVAANDGTTKDDSTDDRLFWKLGTPKPEGFPPDPFLCSLVPRPTAWICVTDDLDDDDDDDKERGGTGGEPHVALLEGYNGASDKPPMVVFAASALPDRASECLRRSKLCTLSVATERDREALSTAAAGGDDDDESRGSRGFAFDELGLEPTRPSEEDDGGRRPPAVASSPIQMHCRLVDFYGLPPSGGCDGGRRREAMVMVEIETFVIGRSVLLRQDDVTDLAAPSTGGNEDVRRVAAKIEADLLRPVGSLGRGRFGTVRGSVYHMLRPTSSIEVRSGDCDDAGHRSRGDEQPPLKWISDDFRRAPPVRRSTGDYHEDVRYSYMKEDRCVLGYNPMKQTVVPRPIGWISSYPSVSEDDDVGRVPHIAPYSFFTDVARGDRPMVAFASCPRDRTKVIMSKDGTTVDKSSLKDAQRDAEETGQFVFNFVSRRRAIEMNYSAAALGREESEFDLASLRHIPALIVDAPMVEGAEVAFECRYVRTVEVPVRKGDEYGYCMIVGEVVGIHICTDVLTDGEIDVGKLCPIARLGYSQEYAVVNNVLKA